MGNVVLGDVVQLNKNGHNRCVSSENRIII